LGGRPRLGLGAGATSCVSSICALFEFTFAVPPPGGGGAGRTGFRRARICCENFRCNNFRHRCIPP
jgi:hypothetical protein